MCWLTSSLVKVNGESEGNFRLSRLVKQGYSLAPYLFILTTDVLSHMLDDKKYNDEFPSHGVKPTLGFHKVKLRKLRLGGTLPASNSRKG